MTQSPFRLQLHYNLKDHLSFQDNTVDTINPQFKAYASESHSILKTRYVESMAQG